MLRHGSKRSSARTYDHLPTLDTCEPVLRHLEILCRLDGFSSVDPELLDRPGQVGSSPESGARSLPTHWLKYVA
jgi:hypothetical protein